MKRDEQAGQGFGRVVNDGYEDVFGRLAGQFGAAGGNGLAQCSCSEVG